MPPSSILGFGCAGLMSRVGKDESKRAIALAFDYGINHFDVARAYGHGEAETLLGEVLAGKRHEVVIATKFGLQPSVAAKRLRWLKPVARSLISVVPALRSVTRSAIGPNVRSAGGFSPEAALASLTASLAALRTDYIDILFLHDARADDLTGPLEEFLHAEVKRGRIRAFGVAASADTVRELAGTGHEGIALQFPNSLTVQNIEGLTARWPLLTHSPFFNMPEIEREIKVHGHDLPERLRHLRSAELRALMLSYALHVNPEGVVVTSMLQPDHVRANIRTADAPPFSAAEIGYVAGLMRQR